MWLTFYQVKLKIKGNVFVLFSMEHFLDIVNLKNLNKNLKTLNSIWKSGNFRNFKFSNELILKLEIESI